MEKFIEQLKSTKKTLERSALFTELMRDVVFELRDHHPVMFAKFQKVVTDKIEEKPKYKKLLEEVI